MTKDEAEQTVRELVDRYGGAPWRIPDADADRLAAAITVLGQGRVFQIAEEQRGRAGAGRDKERSPKPSGP